MMRNEFPVNLTLLCLLLINLIIIDVKAFDVSTLPRNLVKYPCKFQFMLRTFETRWISHKALHNLVSRYL